MLLGSSCLMSAFIIEGRSVSLGDVVRRAQADSGLSPAAWNALHEEDRDVRNVHAFYAIRRDLVPTP